MDTALSILLAWFAASAVIGLALGRFIHGGRRRQIRRRLNDYIKGFREADRITREAR